MRTISVFKRATPFLCLRVPTFLRPLFKVFFSGLLLSCLVKADATAQSTNALSFPSVNNSFLGVSAGALSGSSADVDLYTGTAQVSVPICQLRSRELSIPVALYYTGARGIRVQDYAGPAGLGWQLIAGGGISRVVRGFPDDFSNGYLGTGLWGQKVANALVNNTAMPVEVAGSGLNVPTADGEPDLYNVRTPFFSFQFTFDENGQPVVPNANGMSIIATNFFNSNNGSSHFEVIDDNGNQYYFGSSDSSKEVTSAKLFGTEYGFVTTWYLDRIVSFNSRDVIDMSYTSLTASDLNIHYQSSTQYDFSGHSNTDNTPVQATIYKPKVISNIRGALGEVDFNYAADRIDNGTTARLTGVIVKAYNPASLINNLTLRTYGFNYGYFGSTPSDPNSMRLRLDNITVTGNTPSTAAPLTLTTFTYNQNVNLPARTSLSAVDFWGYYTAPVANPYNASLPASLNYTMANVLTAIKDLSGGTTQFFYELNDYYDAAGSANVQAGGLRVNKIARTLPTGENLYKLYQYAYSNGHSTGEVLSKSYMLNLWVASCGVYKTLSESPSEYYDLNGNFMGYTQVKVVDQNGGYILSTYSNFSSPNSMDIFNYTSGGPVPDVSSSISYAYKRGLLVDQAVYTAGGAIISEDAVPLTAYVSLTSPALKKAWGYRWGIQSFNVTGSGYQNSCSSNASSTYYSLIENFRPTQVIHKDYDQGNPSAYIQTTTTYSYSADKRLVNLLSTTDSKGQSYTRTIYHTGDAAIPMVTANEQTALNYMKGAGINRTAAVVHQLESRNGVVQQTHNAYGLTQYGYITRSYMANTDNYAGTSLVNQQFFKYDPVTSNIVTVQKTGGQAVSYLYGYHSSLPIATVVNAANTYTASSPNGPRYVVLSIPGAAPVSTTFTSTAAGDITLYINASPTYTYTISYTLTGPATKTGYLCASRSATTCTYPETVTFTNMPAGTYTLTSGLNGGSGTDQGVTCTYTGLLGNVTVTNGFFYEGFEEYGGAIRGNAHTGNAYYDGFSSGPYMVNFTLPDARSYIVQWWNWVNGKWVEHQQAYTGPVALSGIVDDVRVYPRDARLSSYTYDLMVGKTGEVSPDGKSATFEFDGLGRMNITRDQDKNILSKTCYTYAGLPLSCPSGTVYSNAVQSGVYTRNNCASGYLPGNVTYTVAAATYTSAISQVDADQLAKNDVHANGQAYANNNGTCTFLYYNVAKTGTYTRNNCPAGYTGGTATYTVAAGVYSSTISQADADQKAVTDVQNNGQAYANANATCTTSAVQKSGNLTLAGSSASVTFTTTIPQSITLTINGWPGSLYTLGYSLSGPSAKSGSLCAKRTSTGTCSFPESVTYTNMPAGTYTLTITIGSGSAATQGLGYTYYGAP
jgi:hypothetical protein